MAETLQGILMLDNNSWIKDRGWIIELFGLCTAILAIGGINFIKHFCLSFLPFILGFLMYAALISDYHVIFSGTWTISIPAIISVMSLVLVGIVNLPTFFRHSRSHADSVLGLTLMPTLSSSKNHFHDLCSIFSFTERSTLQEAQLSLVLKFLELLLEEIPSILHWKGGKISQRVLFLLEKFQPTDRRHKRSLQRPCL